MEIRNYTVYVHISPSNKYYVGITKQKVTRRWRYGSGYKQNKHFYSAIQKYGWNAFQHEIIANNLTKDEACKFEIALISVLKSNQKEFGYNKSAGGEGSSGVIPTEEQRDKKRKRLKGRKRPKEVCERISQSKLGHGVSDETKQKIRHALIGHKISDQSREKLSKSAKIRSKSGRTDIKCVCRPILQYDKNGNFIRKWDSILEATKGLNFKSHGSIDNVLSGRSKTAHGFIFEYA